ncbi:hypothetical protein COV11_01885 [Candidatus Woesearchaeota archaeon CG10_big_fil_rev_8_21_14_0_10_30_7]|nr:MAG: hypothetical protein COV11_01885 [Candidatus Woesearchaeota archaeon CG10_big_fil_rev_8_21_14_0_10_30_7]
MTDYVIDAWAWIEYLEGSDKGKKVANIIEQDSNSLLTSSATVAEVISKFLRVGKNIKIVLSAINNLSFVVNVDNELGISAGKIHFEAKKKNKDFGMLDSFVVATAKKRKARILTGDNDFKQFKEAVFV